MARQIERELQLSTPLQSLARELTLNVYRTDLVLTSALEEALRPAHLHVDEYNVLRILRGAGADGHERGEIQRRMVHAADGLLAIFHRLKSRGLITGVRHLMITPAGLELLASIDPAFEPAIEQRIGWIAASKLKIAIDVLESIRQGPPPPPA